MLFAASGCFLLIWLAVTADDDDDDDDDWNFATFCMNIFCKYEYKYLRLFAADLSLFSTVCYYLLLFAAV